MLVPEESLKKINQCLKNRHARTEIILYGQRLTLINAMVNEQ